MTSVAQPSSARPYGVDFGTSTVRAAVFQDGAPRLIEDSDGSPGFPALASFRAAEPRLGRAALGDAITHPRTTIYDAKRLLGHTAGELGQSGAVARAAFALTANAAGQVALAGAAGPVLLEDVVAHLVRMPTAIAEQRHPTPLGPVVLAVPAWLARPGRDALVAAAQRAGLPGATTISDGLARALVIAASAPAEASLMLVDVGAGGVSAYVVSVGPKRAAVVAAAGDATLGGSDVDAKLALELTARLPPELMAMAQNPAFAAPMRNVARAVKHDLASADHAEQQAPFLRTATGEPATMRLDRARLEAIVRTLSERIAAVIGQALRASLIPASGIRQIHACGGMAQLPPVLTAIEAPFGRKAMVRLGADSVARGAAMFAAILGGGSDLTAAEEGRTYGASRGAPPPSSRASMPSSSVGAGAPPARATGSFPAAQATATRPSGTFPAVQAASTRPTGSFPAAAPPPAARAPSFAPPPPPRAPSFAPPAAARAPSMPPSAGIPAAPRVPSFGAPAPRAASVPPPSIDASSSRVATPDAGPRLATPAIPAAPRMPSIRPSGSFQAVRDPAAGPRATGSVDAAQPAPRTASIVPPSASGSMSLGPTLGDHPVGELARPADAAALLALPMLRLLSPADVDPVALPVLLVRLAGVRSVTGLLTLESGARSITLPIVAGRAHLGKAEHAAVLGAFAWPSGTYSFVEMPLPGEHRPPVTLLELTCEGLRAMLRGFSAEELEAALGDQLDLAPHAIEQRKPLLPRLGLSGTESRLVEHGFDATTTGRELAAHGGAGRHTTYAVLVLLSMFGMLGWKPAEERETETLAAELEKRASRMAFQNHFEALGVHWSATTPDIEKAYRAVVAELAPGSKAAAAAPAACERMRARAEEAHRVLADPTTRTAHRAEAYPLDFDSITDLAERRAAVLDWRGALGDAARQREVAKELAKTREAGGGPRVLTMEQLNAAVEAAEKAAGTSVKKTVPPPR
jgi:actin-like ATPase involved in cell morphogenesis